ncbi:MAG: glycosyltransferase [Candidatus Eisenbacteria bacterium]
MSAVDPIVTRHPETVTTPGPGRIRVLYVVNNFVAGGAERHLLELWRRIDRGRFEVEIACFRHEGRFLDDVEKLGWPVHHLSVPKTLYTPAGVVGLWRLVQLVRARRPDVIHGYLFGPNLFAALAGRWCGVRAVVVAKRNVDAFETPRQIAVQRLSHRLATHVTAVSETVAATSVALGVPRARVTVIPNGVDVGRFDVSPHTRSQLGLDPAAPVIGSVGCLEARKDYGTLFDALERLAAAGRVFQVMLVGDGSERAALETRAASLGRPVRFLGERGDVERLLPVMDVFVLSSREEGIPNALLEAMAAARPCVATSVGGTPEVLADGVTGWLVPPADASALATAIAEALDHPDEAMRRATAARREMIDQRSIDAMVRLHERFYNDVTGGRESS